MIYSGIPYPDPHSLCQTGAIVLKVMEDFIGKGYTVYADNFYNSVNLTKLCLETAHTFVEHLEPLERIIPEKLFGGSLEKERWFGHETKLQSYVSGKIKDIC